VTKTLLMIWTAFQKVIVNVQPTDLMSVFYILMTVHLAMILGKWPTWRTILFYVFISVLYMFRASPCSSSGESSASIQHLVCCTKQSLTQSNVYQMLYWCNWFSWWWALGCSKHVENWNKHIEEKCASSWSFTKNSFQHLSMLQGADYSIFTVSRITWFLEGVNPVVFHKNTF
jgi:hypothetical protein